MGVIHDAQNQPAGEQQWSGRERLRVVAVAVAVIVMLGLPISRLDDGGLTRFGWQMFSHADPLPNFAVVPDDGETYVVEIRDYVPAVRGDLPLDSHLPRHLCEQVSDAAAIEVRDDDGVQSVVTC